MAAIAWYGPLIDLSRAYSHVNDFVQLLVYVHRSDPIQYKLLKGGQVVRTDIQVGDDTRPFFSVSLWNKDMGSNVFPGDIILLQNVKITRFGQVVEARTVQWSSLLCLIHHNESLSSKDSRVGATTKVKLKKVIEWAKRATSSIHRLQHRFQEFSSGTPRNWKLLEQSKPRDCPSISGVLQLTNSCKATFYASVGEIFLPLASEKLDQSEQEKMFISRRVFEMKDNTLADDLICTGCLLCGSPLCTEDGPKPQANSAPLYCQESRNFLHVADFIYRPFMLYVWDETEYLPVLVKNKAAELLFGNISAQKVCLSNNHNADNNYKETAISSKVVAKGISDSREDSKKSVRPKEKCRNFYLIWLILLKLLLQQGKNSPLKFEVIVNTKLDKQDGRFELVFVSMPCLRSEGGYASISTNLHS